MCGRKYASEELNWADYHEALSIVKPLASNLQPNYNIAPTHNVPVCLSINGGHVLEPMQWGLVPHWAKDAKRSYSMINARAETLTEKPSYRGLVKSGRCAVLVSGFYEWKRNGKEKQPYKVEHESGKPMIMAGLWTRNQAMGIDSYTVITTAASPAFEWLHDRQPAILTPDQVNLWLDGPWDDAKVLTDVFLGALATTAVSKDVGNVRNNYPELLNPVAI